MALKAGTKKVVTPPTDLYAGSMAAAMEAAFISEWPVIMGSPAPQPNDHMRLLFIAIAQGVIKHLKDNEDAITVPFSSGTVPVNIETTANDLY